MLVSVLMATYNSASYIVEALESLLNQTYSNIEIIVCDDCSKDNTLEILEQYKQRDQRISYFTNDVNLGYLKTFNNLLKKANGQYITFLDSDDLLSSNKIEIQLDIFKANPSFGFVGTSFVKIDENGKKIGFELMPYSREEIIEKILSNRDLPVCGSSLMIHKDVIRKIGGYKEYYENCPGEDIDWFSRIIDSYDGINLNDGLYFYRFRSGSLTRRVFSSIKQRHIREIISFLYLQRNTNNGKDSLNSNLDGLNDYLNKLEEEYIEDSGMMYRKMSFDYALNSQYLNSFKYFCKSLSRINIKTFKLLIYIIILMIFKKSHLIIIMNFFKFKNINKTL